MTAGSNASSSIETEDGASVSHRAAWSVVLALAFGMLFPVVLLRGMSLDGITYATIARNLSVGLGDAWHPYYTATLHPSFHEQPPLALLLESWFFRVLGDQWWVERLYSVLTALPTAGLIVLIWRRLMARWPGWQAYSWVPVLLWILMPSWYWIYRHNYLENTMGMFTALAVYASLRAFDTSRWWTAWTAVAAVAITAAIGSKGPVGMFPAITPTVAWLTLGEGSLRRACTVQLALVILLAGALGLVMIHPAASEFALAYFHEQVVHSLQGTREMVDSSWGRLYLAWGLLVDLLPSSAIVGAALLVARRTSGSAVGWGPRGPMAFALVTAASASLPIMISPKQSTYYAAPSWPFYMTALGIACVPAVSALAARWAGGQGVAQSARRLRLATAGGVAALVATSPFWCGKVFRDHALLDDVERIAQIVGSHEILFAGPEMREEWSLHAYLYRRHYISLALDAKPRAFRLELAEREHGPPAGYALEDAGLTLFRLYRHLDVAAVAPPPATSR